MKKISVVDFLGTTALLSAEKGYALFEEIVELLKVNSKLVLDFSGYEYISSTFLNRSFGKLSVEKNWDAEELKQHIIIKNLNEDDMEDIELSIFNAKERAKLLDKGIDLHNHYSSVYNY